MSRHDRQRTGWRGAVWAGLLLLPVCALAEDALPMSEAVRLSQIAQPHLRIHDARQFAVNELRYLNVESPALAPFRTAIENLRNRQDVLTQDIVALGDSFLTSDQRMDRRMRRVRMVNHDAEEQVMSRAIAYDVSAAWLDLYEAEHASALEKELQRELESEIASTGIAYRAGRLGQAELWKAEDALAASRERSIGLQERAAMAKAGLQRWIGDKPFVLDEKVEIAEAPTLDELTERVPQLPQLTAYWIAKSIAEDEVKMVEGIYKATPETSTLPQQNVLVAMRSLRDGIHMQMVDALRELHAALRKAYAEWIAVRERRELYEKTVLPNAERRLQAVLAAYAGGKADFAAVLEARRHRIDARMRQLNLMIAAAKARAQLQQYE